QRPAGGETLRAPEVGISQAELTHLLVRDSPREDCQRLVARAHIDALLDEGQRVMAVARAKAKEALVQPAVGKPRLDLQGGVEIRVGIGVMAAAHEQDPAVDEGRGPIGSRERLLLERARAAVERFGPTVGCEGRFVAKMRERPADRHHGALSGGDRQSGGAEHGKDKSSHQSLLFRYAVLLYAHPKSKAPGI